MEITTLPKDLNIVDTSHIQIFNYSRTQDIHKSKIKLAKHTISFLQTGIKEVIGDDERIKINKDHFVIMKAGNCLMTENVSESNKSYQSILLFFSDSTLLSFLEKYNHLSNNQIYQKAFTVFKYDDFIKNYVGSLKQMLNFPLSIQGPLLQHKFEEIMLYLLHQNNANFLNALASKIDDKQLRLMNVSDKNRFNKLSLKELAFLCNMSLSTYKRAFFKAHQSTPMKWFSEQRLNHVAFLLQQKRNLPIELFEQAGYENFTNFVQAFKKRFGLTPKQYQEQS